ncbi:MAG: type II toxin-antitoxin system VapC family toxin [Alphaproteobacteria bacterium]|nr:type II toxin-antitoxin system VapC family toxin [Alphaproteobacteria bacterium]MDE1937825.1 type II toxin-antitoxin system VapC family toxin [Alphaproteobacteria bacterium]MDE2109723.1 type II toxin-antitoxin system VapC family toxin [Alphaproteobacteria bacterium]MDE2494347.1 type II toxin-antitoxin system VapC family toxin [Alphaproteobacteria bacterium]
MIVVDTSVIVAIALNEPGFEQLSRRVFAETERFISPMSIVEATMVLSRAYSDSKTVVDENIKRAGIALYPADEAQVEWAQHAFLTYGKGRHPAKLNLGDCFSYAAAKALNAPLLYVGGDFAKTDVRAA